VPGRSSGLLRARPPWWAVGSVGVGAVLRIEPNTPDTGAEQTRPNTPMTGVGAVPRIGPTSTDNGARQAGPTKALTGVGAARPTTLITGV
jgi:hypothetical protein